MIQDIPVREQVLFNSMKRMFMIYTLFRTSLEEIRTSETLKQWAAIAKSNNNKEFMDLRGPSADLIRGMDSYLMKVKKTMRNDTFNQIYKMLTSENIQEINILLENISDTSEKFLTDLNAEIIVMKSKYHQQNQQS